MLRDEGFFLHMLFLTKLELTQNYFPTPTPWLISTRSLIPVETCRDLETCRTVWKNGKKERKNQKSGFAQAKRLLNTEKRLKHGFKSRKS